ncbi:MAG TPA: hypothetical protein VG944_16880 [Fimbriimonas sp.]|nr:hypothetical protein [Fimbriimonas sp.]
MLSRCLAGAFSGLVCAAAFSPHKASPTYAKDVAPILAARCVSCHSESKVAPFSLVGYENARRFSTMVASVTAQRLMPPWKADLHYGEFRDVPVLSPNEISVLRLWADAGAPRGNPRDEPPPPPVSPGWRMGKPDLVVSPDKATKIPAEGGDFYRDYLIDPHITEPTWVRAVEFRPSGKNTVHHVIPSLLARAEADKCRKIKFDHDDDSWEQRSLKDIDAYNSLGMWSTGAPPFVTPEGTAFLIKPGDCILLDLHYKTTGKPELEQTQVGFYFQKGTPKQEMTLDTVDSESIYLDPGTKANRVYAIEPIKKETTIYAVWPHMHFLGRTFKAWVKYPVGYWKPLVCINDWDPEWQLVYYLKTPLVVPAGAKVYVTGTFDNTKDNPRNPNPTPKVVESGPSSKDEMLLLDLYVVEKKDPAKKSP